MFESKRRRERQREREKQARIKQEIRQKKRRAKRREQKKNIVSDLIEKFIFNSFHTPVSDIEPDSHQIHINAAFFPLDS